MKLYLSSMRLGEKKATLAKMAGPNPRVAFIANGLDIIQNQERKQEVIQRGIDDLAEVGFNPDLIDLRDYFRPEDDITRIIEPYNVIFLTGGNAFVLRRAMKQSGLDAFLRENRNRTDLLYAGYSAGICVAGPTLRSLELVDKPDLIPERYDSEILWDGLGLIRYNLIPHYKSDHFESDTINLVVEHCIDNKILFKALKDGEVEVRE